MILIALTDFAIGIEKGSAKLRHNAKIYAVRR